MIATAPCDRFPLIIEDLCRAIAAHIARDRAAGPLIILAWNRVRRIAARFTRMAARARAGTLRAPRATSRAARERSARRTADGPAPVPPAPAADRPVGLPRHFGWLVGTMPGTAAFGSQLQYLLTDPEMAALLTANPQLVRVLRPLCRMLAIDPIPGIPGLAPRPRASSTKAPKPVPAGAPHGPPEPGRPPPDFSPPDCPSRVRPPPDRASPVGARPPGPAARGALSPEDREVIARCYHFEVVSR